MKKIFKQTLVNLIIICLIAAIADYAYFKIIFEKYKQDCIKENIEIDHNVKYKTYSLIDFNDTSTTNVYKYFLKNKLYRETIIPPPEQFDKNNPIILFGCSYTWMFNNPGLQKSISDLYHATVFNFAYWGWGAQHMYYLISQPDLYKTIKNQTDKSPEFAIYVYIRDHKNRLYPVMDYYLDIEPYLTYDIVNDKLEMKKYNFFEKILFRLFTFRYLKQKLQNHDIEEEYNKLYALISESFYELKKHYPDIKFVVLEYCQDDEEIPEEKEMFEKLENIGIKHISTKTITDVNLKDKEYTIDDGYHPNEKAWEILAKPLVEKLKMIKAE